MNQKKHEKGGEETWPDHPLNCFVLFSRALRRMLREVIAIDRQMIRGLCFLTGIARTR